MRARKVDLPPFRIFVSSPVYGIEDYRYAVMSAARAASTSRKFEFFFYENSENHTIPGRTVCESIFAATELSFDAVFFFFKDRVGKGTWEELEFFETNILPGNPMCQIWWTQIFCDESPADVLSFIQRLLKYNTGLAAVAGEEKIDRPEHLKGRFTAKLFSTISGL
jgi:hypothetical protein